MSIERPKGSYTGPLSLQWCNYSMTVRAMPMNYLAADLSRIDAALWGRESEIGAAIAEAPAMVEALRRILQWIDAGCDPSRKSLENARAILSRIEGAGPPLSAYAETVTDAEYREIANGRASWPLKGASGDGAGDTLPDAPVPAPTSEAKPHLFTVIWGNIGDDNGKRLDHVSVESADQNLIMDAAFECFFKDLERSGQTLTAEDREEFRHNTAYDGYAVLPGHVTDAPGMGFF